MNEQKETESKEETTLSNLCKILQDAELTSKEMFNVINRFLFSVGASLEQVESYLSSEDVLLRHTKKPTYGNALMAQAIWMEETWNSERKKDNG